MLGMVSGLISDSQITASNQGDRNWMPENIRLVTSRSGWALPPAPHPYINEWLQVDLGEEKIVRGIIIQGGKHRENKVFMRKFKIGYSNNGSDWKMIMDDSKRKTKVRSRDRSGFWEGRLFSYHWFKWRISSIFLRKYNFVFLLSHYFSGSVMLSIGPPFQGKQEWDVKSGIWDQHRKEFHCWLPFLPWGRAESSILRRRSGPEAGDLGTDRATLQKLRIS